MTQVYSNTARESDPNALPNAETFYVGRAEQKATCTADGWPTIGESDFGWWYRFCQPGCLPDSDPVGPFLTEQAAIDALREEAEDD